MKFLRIYTPSEEKRPPLSPEAKAMEWAVPATCIFSKVDLDSPSAQEKIFNGWMGTESFGYARYVEVSEIQQREFQQAINRLAHHLVEIGLCKDLDEAFAVANDEADHAGKLANREEGTVLAVERKITDYGMTETFMTVPKE